MPNAGLTIGDVADAAGVGIETIRYYERRGLVPQPGKAAGAYRRYGAGHVDRIRFIKRAQELGFSLAEIAQLLRLQDGVDRRAIRSISLQRLAQIEVKLADLKRMQRVLKHLVKACEEAAPDRACPIIKSLSARN